LIDLHSHSTASDGSLSPTALVAMARERGLRALALTDHDTVAGLAEAEAAASASEALADGSHLRLIRGVEIEIAFEPGEFHLLGLDLGPLDGPGGKDLLDALKKLGSARAARNRRIMQKIIDAGIATSMEELEEAAGNSRPGRPHIASLLVKHKAAKNRQDAFSRFLAKGRPYYEPKDCLALDEALELVKAAGGLAIVAHPLSLFASWTRLSGLMDESKELGIDGIEAYHPVAKLGQCRRLEAMGRERGFMITAGSDYHGAVRPERRLGRTAGDLNIEDSFLEALAR